LVSIVTINYNNSKGLKKTLESITKLNFEHELIIVDGDSNDNSLAVVTGYNNKISNIKLISEKDKGVYDAMNKGIKNAKGDWVIFMNSGDCFYETDDMAQILEDHSTYDLLYGNTRMEGKIFHPKNLKALEHGIIHACHQSMFFNFKKLSDELRYINFYKIYADYELVNRLYLKNFKFKYIDRCISEIEPGGISQSVSWRKRIDKFLIVINSNGLIRGVIKAYLKKKNV
tara:strand:- start:5697 stop:6383 length:687 start_codon:yes stop_codon:yes gene_type:complete